MGDTRNLSVEVTVDEDEERTEAKVGVMIRDREFSGWGRAKRNPNDPNVPMIGEELAVARALNDLSQNLLDAAAQAIEEFEGRPVDLHP